MIVAESLKMELDSLLKRQDVSVALNKVDEWSGEILKEWRTIVEISAPSGQEEERSKYLATQLRRYGCDEVHFDAKGNLIALRNGSDGGAIVAFDAHTDVAYKEKFPIQTRIADGKLYGPGAHDDAAALVACLYAVRALNASGIRTRGDLIFAGTVEEEIGVRGGRIFVEENHKRIDWYVFCDGEFGEIRHGQSSGIRWWKIHMRGDGGHPWTDLIPYSAAKGVAKAITRIYDEVQFVREPISLRSSVNIGMMGADDAPNKKASHAWFSLDLRSLDMDELERISGEATRIITEVAEDMGFTWEKEILTELPAGSIPDSEGTRIVQAAVAIGQVLGSQPRLMMGGVGMSWAIAKGIPSVTLGATTRGYIHSPNEWAGIEPIYSGIKQYILLALMLAGIV